MSTEEEFEAAVRAHVKRVQRRAADETLTRLQLRVADVGPKDKLTVGFDDGTSVELACGDRVRGIIARLRADFA